MNAARGFTVIEIIVVVTIAALAFVSLIGLYGYSIKALAQNKNSDQALGLATEALEIIRLMRDGSWDNLANLSVDTGYHPLKSGLPAGWTLAAGAESIGIFSRKVVLGNVYRDDNANIVASGGTLDSQTKKITVTVSWGSRDLSLITYLTNWR